MKWVLVRLVVRSCWLKLVLLLHNNNVLIFLICCILVRHCVCTKLLLALDLSQSKCVWEQRIVQAESALSQLLALYISISNTVKY